MYENGDLEGTVYLVIDGTLQKKEGNPQMDTPGASGTLIRSGMTFGQPEQNQQRHPPSLIGFNPEDSQLLMDDEEMSSGRSSRRHWSSPRRHTSYNPNNSLHTDSSPRPGSIPIQAILARTNSRDKLTPLSTSRLSRKHTMTTITDCRILAIRQNLYKDALQLSAREQEEEKLSFVHLLIPSTLSWSPEKMIKFMATLREIKVPSKSVICRQRNAADNVYFIQKGECVLKWFDDSDMKPPEESIDTTMSTGLVHLTGHKSPAFKKSRGGNRVVTNNSSCTTLQRSYNKTSEQTSDVLDVHGRLKMRLNLYDHEYLSSGSKSLDQLPLGCEVAHLGPNQIFGLHDMMVTGFNMYSVVTRTTVTMLVATKEDFLYHIKKDALEQLRAQEEKRVFFQNSARTKVAHTMSKSTKKIPPKALITGVEVDELNTLRPVNVKPVTRKSEPSASQESEEEKKKNMLEEGDGYVLQEELEDKQISVVGKAKEGIQWLSEGVSNINKFPKLQRKMLRLANHKAIFNNAPLSRNVRRLQEQEQVPNTKLTGTFIPSKQAEEIKSQLVPQDQVEPEQGNLLIEYHPPDPTTVTNTFLTSSAPIPEEDSVGDSESALELVGDIEYSRLQGEVSLNKDKGVLKRRKEENNVSGPTYEAFCDSKLVPSDNLTHVGMLDLKTVMPYVRKASKRERAKLLHIRRTSEQPYSSKYVVNPKNGMPALYDSLRFDENIRQLTANIARQHDLESEQKENLVSKRPATASRASILKVHTAIGTERPHSAAPSVQHANNHIAQSEEEENRGPLSERRATASRALTLNAETAKDTKRPHSAASSLYNSAIHTDSVDVKKLSSADERPLRGNPNVLGKDKVAPLRRQRQSILVGSHSWSTGALGLANLPASQLNTALKPVKEAADKSVLADAEAQRKISTKTANRAEHKKLKSTAKRAQSAAAGRLRFDAKGKKSSTVRPQTPGVIRYDDNEGLEAAEQLVYYRHTYVVTIAGRVMKSFIDD